MTPGIPLPTKNGVKSGNKDAWRLSYCEHFCYGPCNESDATIATQREQ